MLLPVCVSSPPLDPGGVPKPCGKGLANESYGVMPSSELTQLYWVRYPNGPMVLVACCGETPKKFPHPPRITVLSLALNAKPMRGARLLVSQIYWCRPIPLTFTNTRPPL